MQRAIVRGFVAGVAAVVIGASSLAYAAPRHHHHHHHHRPRVVCRFITLGGDVPKPTVTPQFHRVQVCDSLAG